MWHDRVLPASAARLAFARLLGGCLAPPSVMDGRLVVGGLAGWGFGCEVAGLAPGDGDTEGLGGRDPGDVAPAHPGLRGPRGSCPSRGPWAMVYRGVGQRDSPDPDHQRLDWEDATSATVLETAPPETGPDPTLDLLCGLSCSEPSERTHADRVVTSSRRDPAQTVPRVASASPARPPSLASCRLAPREVRQPRAFDFPLRAAPPYRINLG